MVLTGSDKLRWANFAVAFGADSIHGVRVELTAARIGEEAGAVLCPALSHLAIVVFSRGHVVKSVVGWLPAEEDHIA